MQPISGQQKLKLDVFKLFCHGMGRYKKTDDPLVFSLFLVLVFIRKIYKDYHFRSDEVEIELIFDPEFQSRNSISTGENGNSDYDDGDSDLKFYDEPYVI